MLQRMSHSCNSFPNTHQLGTRRSCTNAVCYTLVAQREEVATKQPAIWEVFSGGFISSRFEIIISMSSTVGSLEKEESMCSG